MGYETQYPNDYETNESYIDISCEGIYKSFEEAVISTGLNINDFSESLLNDDTFYLGKGWKYSYARKCVFIIKKELK